MIAQLLAPQPADSVLNDSDMQAEYWRNQAEAKAEEIEDLKESRNALRKEVERFGRQKEVRKDPRKESPKPSNSRASKPADIIGATKTSINVEATAYTAKCEGCSGITAAGYDVRSTIYTPEGLRVLAAPPSIPFHTKMRVRLSDGSSFVGVVLDRGGAIGEGKLDILVKTKQEAIVLGRQAATIEIISE